jgi:hypothetical protein
MKDNASQGTKTWYVRDASGTIMSLYEETNETGYNAFEIRLWDSRIGRRMTTDLYNQYHSPYLGMGNCPVMRVDADGGTDWPIFFKKLSFTHSRTGRTRQKWSWTNSILIPNKTGSSKTGKWWLTPDGGTPLADWMLQSRINKRDDPNISPVARQYYTSVVNSMENRIEQEYDWAYTGGGKSPYSFLDFVPNTKANDKYYIDKGRVQNASIRYFSISSRELISYSGIPGSPSLFTPVRGRWTDRILGSNFNGGRNLNVGLPFQLAIFQDRIWDYNASLTTSVFHGVVYRNVTIRPPLRVSVTY